MRKTTAFAIVGLLATGCGSSQSADPVDPIETTETTETETTETETTETETTETETVEAPVSGLRIVDMDSLEWLPIDPEAGEAGPMFAPLSGDPQSEATLMLIKAPAKFPGGAHIHTNAYHAVVIKGVVKNDKPKAKKPLAMGTGSYWAQQGGAAHVTSCPEECMAVVYFEGPMDGMPPGAKMEAMGAASKNQTLAQVKWFPATEAGEAGPMLGPLWGDMENGPNGFLVKMPAGSPGAMHWHTSDYHAVTIQGTPRNWEESEATKDVPLPPGTYWFQPGKVSHVTSCDEGDDCIVYVQMPGVADAHMTAEEPPPAD